MRPPRVRYDWNPIESAPFDEDIAVQVTDGRGAPYAIRWPCRRMQSCQAEKAVRDRRPDYFAFARNVSVKRSVGSVAGFEDGTACFKHSLFFRDRRTVLPRDELKAPPNVAPTRVDPSWSFGTALRLAA
jgi:hypothetical protein